MRNSRTVRLLVLKEFVNSFGVSAIQFKLPNSIYVRSVSSACRLLLDLPNSLFPPDFCKGFYEFSLA